MPISHSSGEFLKASAERNIKLIKGEENKIDSIIKSNPDVKYIASQKGYWYYYENKSDKYVIYSQLELKPQNYVVDKQNILMGLRHGIKLMKKSEKVTFLFPSHMAYGYHGDNRRIGTNEPIICTVTLNDIKNENKTTEE
jgi:hypothetical protein